MALRLIWCARTGQYAVKAALLFMMAQSTPAYAIPASADTNGSGRKRIRCSLRRWMKTGTEADVDWTLQDSARDMNRSQRNIMLTVTNPAKMACIMKKYAWIVGIGVRRRAVSTFRTRMTMGRTTAEKASVRLTAGIAAVADAAGAAMRKSRTQERKKKIQARKPETNARTRRKREKMKAREKGWKRKIRIRSQETRIRTQEKKVKMRMNCFLNCQHSFKLNGRIG